MIHMLPYVWRVVVVDSYALTCLRGPCCWFICSHVSQGSWLLINKLSCVSWVLVFYSYALICLKGPCWWFICSHVSQGSLVLMIHMLACVSRVLVVDDSYALMCLRGPCWWFICSHVSQGSLLLISSRPFKVNLTCFPCSDNEYNCHVQLFFKWHGCHIMYLC